MEVEPLALMECLIRTSHFQTLEMVIHISDSTRLVTVRLVSQEWIPQAILIVHQEWNAFSHRFKTGTNAQQEPTQRTAQDTVSLVQVARIVHSVKIPLSLYDLDISLQLISTLNLFLLLDGRVTTVSQIY